MACVRRPLQLLHAWMSRVPAQLLPRAVRVVVRSRVHSVGQFLVVYQIHARDPSDLRPVQITRQLLEGYMGDRLAVGDLPLPSFILGDYGTLQSLSQRLRRLLPQLAALPCLRIDCDSSRCTDICRVRRPRAARTAVYCPLAAETSAGSRVLRCPGPGGPRQLRRAEVDVQCVLKLSLKIIV